MIIRKISKLTIFIALIGFFVSLYALFLHIKNLMTPGAGSICDINATINCSAVIGSKYGEFASIPLGSYGMAYFALLFAAAITPKFVSTTKKQLAIIEIGLAAIGVLVVGLLMGISYGILKLVCPTCSVTHALVLLYACVKSFEWFKLFKQKKHDQHVNDESQSEQLFQQTNPYRTFFALALCFSIPPLMIGLFSPLLVDYFLPKKTLEAELSSVQKKLNADLKSFNKSNYIGNGEDYRYGNDNAPIVVQVFSDFGCPHCKTANDALIAAQHAFGIDKVVLVYRFYPLSNECNQFVGGKGWYTYNCSLVVAARCAGQQEKFWEFKDWAFSGQDWTDQERAKNFSLDGLKNQAKQLNMNVETFEQCLTGHSEDNKMRDDIILANSLSIQGTPLIIINGEIFHGAPNSKMLLEKFKQACAQSPLCR